MPIKVCLCVASVKRPEFGDKEDMVAGAKQLAEKIVAQSAKDTVLKFRVTNGARHTTAFSTTLSFKLRAFLHPSYKERT
ncbi:hypothetical protein [Paraglaciecola arctica]|nr:hypothetical protein [Paraglaciecola arctica]